MDIPELWQGHLLADREKPSKTDGPVEKLAFYYLPQDNLTKPVPVLHINVYDKERDRERQFTPEPNFDVFLETRRYNFAFMYDSEASAALTDKVDQAIVRQIAARASDDIFLAGLIWPASDDEKIFTNTLWVYGERLRAKPFKQKNVTYLPIRKVCEALGYKVGWLEDDRAISIYKAKTDEYFFLLLDNPKNNPAISYGYQITILNDSAYISTLFFTTHLRVNIRVDERSNVFIY